MLSKACAGEGVIAHCYDTLGEVFPGATPRPFGTLPAEEQGVAAMYASGEWDRLSTADRARRGGLAAAGPLVNVVHAQAPQAELTNDAGTEETYQDAHRDLAAEAVAVEAAVA